MVKVDEGYGNIRSERITAENNEILKNELDYNGVPERVSNTFIRFKVGGRFEIGYDENKDFVIKRGNKICRFPADLLERAERRFIEGCLILEIRERLTKKEK